MADAEQNELKADIENILTKAAESKNIKNFELRPDLNVQVGDGFVSHFYRGDIVNKDTREVIHVAIKKVPKWEWDFSKIFHNEITFYSQLMPALNEVQSHANLLNRFDNIPEYLTSGSELKKEYIVMEDLKQKGYALHEKKKCFDKEQLELVFRTYGKFHALSFVLRKQNFEKYKEINNEYTDVFYMFLEMESSRKLFEDAVKATVDALQPESAVFEIARDLSKNVTETVSQSFTYKGDNRCSTHGDCWSNNMLFKYSESGKLEDVKLIDFQLARDGTPVHDLSYFFYSSASKTDLDALEDYLKVYHDSLSETMRNLGENPEKIFPFDTLIKEWKENALMGVVLGIYLWQIKLLPKEEYEDFLKNAGPTDKDAIAEATKFFGELLAKTFKSDMYIQRTTDILYHAYDYGVLTKEKIVYKTGDTVPASDSIATEL